jgi:hypothetical protein
MRNQKLACAIRNWRYVKNTELRIPSEVDHEHVPEGDAVRHRTCRSCNSPGSREVPRAIARVSIIFKPGSRAVPGTSRTGVLLAPS